MNPSPEIAERLERLTGLIKNSQYRSYDIKVPKDDLRAALTKALQRIADMNPKGDKPNLLPAWRKAKGIALAALNPSLNGGDDKSGGRHEA